MLTIVLSPGESSPFVNKGGFSSDNFKNSEIVISGGQVINLNANENADLWWVLKGACGNNFGIVTRMDMYTIPIPTGVLGGIITHPMEKVLQILDAF